MIFAICFIKIYLATNSLFGEITADKKIVRFFKCPYQQLSVLTLLRSVVSQPQAVR